MMVSLMDMFGNRCATKIITVRIVVQRSFHQLKKKNKQG